MKKKRAIAWITLVLLYLSMIGPWPTPCPAEPLKMKVIAVDPWMDVRAFGAVGDGATDDTAAIQAAIDNACAVGGTVFFPGLEFKVTSTLTVTPFYPIKMMGISNASYRIGVGYGYPDAATLASSVDFSFGSRIYYTGTGILFQCQSARSIKFENLVMLGPGWRTAGSKGISLTNSIAFTIQECRILYFETGIETGTGGDGNGDTNFFINNFITACVYGIRFKQSQNYINTIIHNIVEAREPIRADYTVGVHILGGWYVPSLAEEGVDYFRTTVAAKGATNITLDNVTGATAGMKILLQRSGEKYGQWENDWVAPMDFIGTVTGDNVTLTYTDIPSSSITVGDNVYFGNFPVAFQIRNGSIKGTHIETSQGLYPALINGCYGLLWTGPSPQYNRSTVVFENNLVGMTTGASATSLDMMLPTFYNSTGTNSLGVRLVVRNNTMMVPYAKLHIDGESVFENNTWSSEPFLTSYNARPPLSLKINDSFAWYWGADAATAAPITSYGNLLDFRGSFTILQPHSWYGRQSVQEPTHMYEGEFITATGTEFPNHIGWKERTSGATFAADIGIKSTIVLTTQGSMTSGTNKFVSTNLTAADTGLRPRMKIVIPGAGPAAADLTTTVMHVNAKNSTVYTYHNASTTVSGVTLKSVAPDVKKYGRQAEFGTAAPATGTWAQGDISWKTNVSTTDNVVGWICTVAGTPGTWKQMVIPLQ